MSDYEALVEGLVLSVTAPTMALCMEVVATAEAIAVRLPLADVERAKRDAEKILKAMHSKGADYVH